jgi:putative tryptophan/tyrosine transport system substrate-binding protein
MRKNILSFGFWSMLFTLCVPASAKQPDKVAHIGILDSGSASDPRNALGREAIRQGIRELGYVEAKNINISYRYDEGRSGRLPELAEELVRLEADIIVANNTTAARAAKKSSATIPIIFTTGGNPVTSGLVASLARPGGNITGVTTNSPELVGKRLGLLRETVPRVFRFGFLMPAETTTIKDMFDEAQGTAKVLGVQFQAVKVKVPNPDFEDAFRFMAKERIGGLVTEGPPSIALHRKQILELAEKNRLPAIHTEQEWANDGGLMSYGANRNDPYRRAAVFVDKILKGAKPADLPVEQPQKFEFVINLKTAKALNLTIPQSVLFRADRVIR